LNDKEKLLTRMILAKSVKISPDSVDVHDADDKTLYLIHDFKGMNFAFCFKEVPTIDKAREEIKDCYLSGCEVDFDIEFSGEY